jgi:hypothetical protein
MEAMEEDIIELLRLPTPTHPAFDSPGYIEMLVAPLEELLFPVASPKRSFSEMALERPSYPNIQSLDDQQPEAVGGTENTVAIPAKKRFFSSRVSKAVTNSGAGGDVFLALLRETTMLAKWVNCDACIVERDDGK